MKTIGLIGGMSWESTVDYYRLINTLVKQQLGGLHSAKIILYSVEFAEIETLQRQGDWETAGRILADAAKKLEIAGADYLLLCTNTMHIVAESITNAINIPFLHIADATALALQRDHIKNVGLLGTSFTMEQPFYKDRLTHEHGFNVIIPKVDDRKIVHEIIFKELCLGEIRKESKVAYLTIMNNLKRQGAEAIILGCTEIGMLIKQQDTPIPLYDTTYLHAQRAVEMTMKTT